MWPDDDALRAAWVALVADPLTAGGEFAQLVLAPLAAQLARKYPKADPADIDTAAEDAVLFVLKHPERYDPARRSPRGYLLMVASADLLNILAQGRRHHANRIPWDSVELDLPDGNEEEDADDLPSWDSPEVQSVVAGFDAEERTAFDLMRGGERDTTTFAAALGWPGDTTDDVKRLKDRVMARLKRARRRTP